MKGTLLSAEVSRFHALNSDGLLWTLVIKTRFLRRKVTVKKTLHPSVDVRSFIGKRVEV